MHEACGLVVELEQTGFSSSAFVSFWVVGILLHNHACTAGEFLDRIRKRQGFVCHDKANGIAALATTKAMVGLAGWIDHE